MIDRPSSGDLAEAEAEWVADGLVRRAMPMRWRVLRWLFPRTRGTAALICAVPLASGAFLCLWLSVDTGTLVLPGWEATGLLVVATVAAWAMWRVGCAGWLRPGRWRTLARLALLKVWRFVL